jgi:hypothetical protein
MSQPSDRYIRAERLPFRRLDDQTVIVDPKRREVHVLNGIGSAIWDLLAQTRNVFDLIEALERDGRFDADGETISNDVRGFLTDLIGKGLITVDPAPLPAESPR